MAEPNPVANVLVVDDKPANLLALGAVLQPLGVRVFEASSGIEALAHVESEDFAVVLLDVQMPLMDGFEVARRLRASERGHSLPIIFLTAIHRDEDKAREGYAAGAADYMTKPYDVDVLCARVKAFVELFHQREKLRLEEVGARTRERDAALERLTTLLESERLARLEAMAANHAKDEFLATVSHELRTPLNAILGWTVIARQLAGGGPLDRPLSIIERNARAQTRIIEDVLDVSRAISGKLHLELASVDIAHVIGGAIEAVRLAAENKGVRIQTTIDSAIGCVSGDAGRLQQVVWNILSNAIKFTPERGRVEVHAERVDSRVVVRVVDTGQGIAPELLEHIFEPFRQADGSTTRRHGGLGLGLSIVKQLVLAHGGEVSAHSGGLGKGATFVVALPAMRASEPGGDLADSTPPPASTDIRLDEVRVLVVDDEPDATLLIEHLLAAQGAQVRCASSAQEGLDILDAFHPSVIVSDIGMPDVDGYAFVQKLRSRPSESGGKIPAIALTAFARPEDVDRAIAAGFQAHIAKPVQIDRLISLVANLGGISLGSVLEPEVKQWKTNRRGQGKS